MRFGALVLVLAFTLPACRNDPPAPGAAESSTAEFSPDRPPAMGALGTVAAAGEEWNTAEIDWQPYEAGLARAKAEHKPVCLVLYADWCPHCKNYSRVFADKRVVERAKSFVMVRVNTTDDDAVSRRYVADGNYVPRTYFLASDGAAATDVHAARDRYLYFYDERDPGSLLDGMSAALKKMASR